jgi:MFS family permease
METQKHSRLGIASFVVGITSVICSLALLCSFILFIGGSVASKYSGGWEGFFVLFVVGIFCYFLMGFSMIGIGLGIAGILEKERKSIFAILGLALSALVFSITAYFFMSPFVFFSITLSFIFVTYFFLWQPFHFLSQEPRMEAQKHSKCGIASFVLGVTSANFISVFPSTGVVWNVSSGMEWHLVLLLVGLLIFGVGFGMAGVLAKDRKKIFALLGLALLAPVILFTVFEFVISAVLRLISAGIFTQSIALVPIMVVSSRLFHMAATPLS